MGAPSYGMVSSECGSRARACKELCTHTAHAAELGLAQERRHKRGLKGAGPDKAIEVRPHHAGLSGELQTVEMLLINLPR